MPPPGRIAIIGSGPAGLTLSRCLKAKGISSTIYDKYPEARTYGNSIILEPAHYQPVLETLGISFGTFYSQTTVQRDRAPQEPIAFRAGRTAFEDVLRDGIDIKYGHEVKSVSSTASGIDLEFSERQKTTTDLLIGADGTHSSVRSALLPHFQLKVLPYVAINGKRRMSASGFTAVKDAFERDLTISHRIGSTVLQAYINGIDDDGGARISYTYSRPARGPDDPCHKPNRPKASAKHIPEEFFTEVKQLQDQGIPQPWKSIFDVDAMKDDRLLHWLMRTGLPPKADVEAEAQQNRLLLGDSLLTSPIIGSRGANIAMQQAVDLADAIEQGTHQQWMSTNYDSFQATANDDVARLEEMHRSDSKI